ncbi:MAG: Crp/Fnr family transcriptional regulator [Acetivibrio ethanolgignens]
MTKRMEGYIPELNKMPLFSGIKEDDIVNVLSCLGAFRKEYKKREYIILCDDDVHSVGVILHGKVQMLREDMWGNKSILTSMITGELFGETFACGSLLRSTVSFLAVEETRVLFLPFEKMMKSCTMSCIFHHRLIENMVTLIADKNVQLMEKIDIISKNSLREKILAYLLFQEEHQQSPYIESPLGRVQLAEYLHADRSALTRELNLMKKDGLIDFEKNSFRITGKLDRPSTCGK